jgi:hypothetical protein
VQTLDGQSFILKSINMNYRQQFLSGELIIKNDNHELMLQLLKELYPRDSWSADRDYYWIETRNARPAYCYGEKDVPGTSSIMTITQFMKGTKFKMKVTPELMDQFHSTQWQLHYSFDNINSQHAAKMFLKMMTGQDIDLSVWKHCKYICGSPGQFLHYKVDPHTKDGKNIDIYDALDLDFDEERKSRLEIKQSISRQGLKELYDAACGIWKAKLTAIASQSPWHDYIILNDKFIVEMFKAADNKQRDVLLKYLKEPEPEFTLASEVVYNGNEYDSSLIKRIKHGPYKDRALSLVNRFNWELRTVGGFQILIPTPKS